MQRGDRIVLDTNAIIEAHRVKCWKLMLEYFAVESTEECCREAASGESRTAGYVVVDVPAMREAIRIHRPPAAMIARAATTALNFQSIDPGEREVLAVAMADPRLQRIGTADRIAIQVASQLGLLDRVVSLEEILETVGDSRPLMAHHCKKWLSDIRLQLLLGNLN